MGTRTAGLPDTAWDRLGDRGRSTDPTTNLQTLCHATGSTRGSSAAFALLLLPNAIPDSYRDLC
ncbi:hypothetical protein, partial [Streptomyces sp. HYC2]|uniref:hypothetical protein n=1 Tax=Streptomyces sp. HYC2 TaxID=2955207 RepID=UPI0024817226